MAKIWSWLTGGRRPRPQSTTFRGEFGSLTVSDGYSTADTFIEGTVQDLNVAGAVHKPRHRR